MKNFKEKLKNLKNPFLIVLTVFMFILSLFTAYSYGYDKGSNSTNDIQYNLRKNTTRDVDDSYYVSYNKYTYLSVKRTYGESLAVDSVALEYDSVSYNISDNNLKYFGISLDGSSFTSFVNLQDYNSTNFTFITDNFLANGSTSYTANLYYVYNDSNYQVIFDSISYCNVKNANSSNKVIIPFNITFNNYYLYLISNPNYQFSITNNYSSVYTSNITTISYSSTSWSGGSSGSIQSSVKYYLSGSTTSSFYINKIYPSNPNAIENAYNEGYQVGLVEGEENANESLYNEGFTAGVQYSSDPYYNMRTGYFDLYYYRQDDSIYYEYEYTPINLDLYNYYDFNDAFISLYPEWESDDNKSLDNLSYILLSDFGNVNVDSYNFIITGFTKVEFTLDRNNTYVYNISQPAEYTTLNLEELNGNVTDIILTTNMTNEYFNENGYKFGFNYNNTYENGYQNGYNQGLSKGNEEGYNVGFTEGKNEGVTIGYNQGYESGYNVGNSETCKLNTLVFSIADIPVYILSKLLGFEIFGFNIFVALCSVITILLIVYLVKKFS